MRDIWEGKQDEGFMNIRWRNLGGGAEGGGGMRKVLIIGATSAIAEAAARIWIQRGDHVCLVARHESRLSAIAADLKVRGGMGVHIHVMDANDIDQHEVMIEAASVAAHVARQ